MSDNLHLLVLNKRIIAESLFEPEVELREQGQGPEGPWSLRVFTRSSSLWVRGHPAGAKALTHFVMTIGPTEVVPLLQCEKQLQILRLRLRMTIPVCVPG